MPVIVKVPDIAPREDFLLAYSCMPAALTALADIKTRKVVLFTKNVEKWATYYSDLGCANIQVKPVGGEFAGYLSRCAGLVASPSPGVVTQALACGKPAYLICPPGHLEQQFNQDYYFKVRGAVARAIACLVSSPSAARCTGVSGPRPPRPRPQCAPSPPRLGSTSSASQARC